MRRWGVLLVLSGALVIELAACSDGDPVEDAVEDVSSDDGASDVPVDVGGDVGEPDVTTQDIGPTDNNSQADADVDEVEDQGTADDSTATDTNVIEDSGTDVALEVVEPITSGCVACHTDKTRMIALAVEDEAGTTGGG